MVMVRDVNRTVAQFNLFSVIFGYFRLLRISFFDREIHVGILTKFSILINLLYIS